MKERPSINQQQDNLAANQQTQKCLLETDILLGAPFIGVTVLICRP